MQTPPSRLRDAAAVGVVHVLLAAYFWLGRGVTIVHEFGPDPWSWFWQNVPADLLRNRALESLWWLHAQPPLWNALGAALIKAFGDAHMPALQALNIVLGACTAGLVVALVGRLTARRWLALAAGAAVALHPSLFLYEAYALYTVLVALLVVLGAYLLTGEEGPSWGETVAFVAVMTGLVLTRSLYHLVLVGAAVALVLWLRGRPPRRVVLALTALCLLPAAWYGKNLVQHGFFGASSWYGMGLWRSALFQQDTELLDRMFADGELERVVQVAPFSPASAYWDFGYREGTSVPLLGRDDLHNVNIPAISAGYQRSARRLVLRSPARYAANIALGYGNFSAPSSAFNHLVPNRDRMGFYGSLDQWLTLRPVFAALEARIGRGYYGSVYFFLLPAVLLAYLLQVTGGTRWRNAGLRIRQDPAGIFLAAIIAYTAVVGCTMELGENVRFKFPVEPAFIALTSVVLHRLVTGRSEPRTDEEEGPTS